MKTAAINLKYKGEIMNFLKVVLTVFFLFSFRIIEAETIEYKEGGISFFLPETWESDSDEFGLLIFPFDESLVIGFFPTTTDDMFEYFDCLIEELKEQIGEIEFEKPEEEYLNGMKALYGEGSTLEGDIMVAYFIFETGEDNALIMLGFGSEEEAEIHEDEVELLLESIRAL